MLKSSHINRAYRELNVITKPYMVKSLHITQAYKLFDIITSAYI